MKIYFRLLFLLISAFVSAQNTADSSTERIINFSSEIFVDGDGSILVTENIRVNALGNQIKHGIFRSLPLERNINDEKEQVRYEIISVKKDGSAENYSKKDEGGFLKIYIGNEDKLLTNGIHTYEIRYRAPKQIGFFKNYDEIYWNVNGTFWNFPTEKITATVHLPKDADIIQNSCYTGSYGNSKKKCTYQLTDKNTIIWSAEDLQPNENLTVSAGFKIGAIHRPPPPTFLEKYGTTVFLALVSLFLIYYFFSSWDKYGRDPAKPTVYPQFDAPQNLSPASLGYIKKNDFDDKFLTASIVNLAVKGYLKIEEKKPSDGFDRLFGKKVFTLEKLKDSAQDLPSEERLLFDKFFPGSKKSMILNGDYNQKIESTVEKFKQNLVLQHDKFLNEGNNTMKLILPAAIIVSAYLLSAIINAEISGNGLSWLILLPLAIPILCILFFYIFKKTKKIGFTKIFFMAVAAFWLIGAASQIAIILSKGSFGKKADFIFVICSSAALLLYAYLIKKPSPQKQEILSQIEGFKMYLGTAEANQLKFFNPPQMTPQIFEKLLPYAMVLGVDKIWGEKFAAMLAASATAYTSGWYFGGNFHASSFGNTLNSHLSGTLSSASSAPSSSGSGSGGGGFSGGGGGGGGGGGW